LRRLLVEEYPELYRLAEGPSYVEMGVLLDSQELALLLIGLGALVGLWDAITPETLGVTGGSADELAGAGFVLCSGMTSFRCPGIPRERDSGAQGGQP